MLLSCDVCIYIVLCVCFSPGTLVRTSLLYCCRLWPGLYRWAEEQQLAMCGKVVFEGVEGGGKRREQARVECV